MIQLALAFELAHNRSRETALYLQRRDAGRAATAPDNGPRRRHPLRALVARAVRALAGASHALSEAACMAALRIEGTAR